MNEGETRPLRGTGTTEGRRLQRRWDTIVLAGVCLFTAIGVALVILFGVGWL